ncbi:MAG: hypothetical protein CML06_19790 [Pseudomonadales bacterium]|nr:hypothetical protein [Pseudomonadales bacterium]
MTKTFKIVLPILAIALGAIVSVALFMARPEAQHQPLDIKPPLVTVTEVQAKSASIPVLTRGTVTPGTEIQLISEVSGQVLELSPNFANGGFFRKGEELIRIDPIEYEVNIKRAEAQKAQAYQALLQAEAEKKARSRVRNNLSDLGRYEVQYQQAKAQYDAAVAELEAVKMQKQRTVVRAPFDGRVRLAALNVGQYVRPGQQMGAIYAVDVAEVRLPLSDRQLSLVDVPMRYQEAQDRTLPEVTLTEQFAGRTYSWKGQVVRAEGGVDERNRLLYVVARVQDPYAQDPNQPGRPELVAGTFVEATIAGRHFERVFEVPRKALRNGNELWVVDQNQKLRQRDVSIIYKGKDSIYISSGLENGDMVVLSQMDIAVDGMSVRTQRADDYEFEPDPEQPQLFGNTANAETAVTQSETGIAMRVDPNDPQVQRLAQQARAMAEGMDTEQKQKLLDSARGMLQQARDMQAALQPARTEPAPTDSEPAVAPGATAVDSSAEPAAGMSPLAAQLEADLQRQSPSPTAVESSAKESSAESESAAAAESTAAESTAADSPQPAASVANTTPAPANKDSGDSGKVTLSVVAAPEPLVEAVQ